VSLHLTTGGVAANPGRLVDVTTDALGAPIGLSGRSGIGRLLSYLPPPAGVRRSEFLLTHRMIDTIVVQNQMTPTESSLLQRLRDRAQ